MSKISAPHWLFASAILGSSLLSGCAAPPRTPLAGATQQIKSSAPVEPYRSAAEIIEAAPASDWRPLEVDRLLVMQLAAGTVVLELAPQFAPKHVENLKLLVQKGYFDGLAIVRSQDNFVVQWGDPNAGTEQRRSLGQASAKLAPEFERPIGDLSFTRLPDADGFAPEVGFSEGFPVGRDPSTNTTWIAHCYGVLGAGRDTDSDSGNGAELYVVSGHAPRQLDRNISVVGRVVLGMEWLSTRVRGPAPMGFYTDASLRTPIQAVRLASELPIEAQPALEALRTDSASFTALIEARRNRRDSWYKRPAGHIDLCNVPLPVRAKPRPN